MILKISPGKHYLLYHSDVEWELVVKAVLSPTKTLANKRYGKQRLTYIRKFTVKLHAEKVDNEITS